MSTAPILRDIASQIQGAQADVRLIEPFTSRIPAFDLQSAYAVARLIHDDRLSRGAVPVGRKIGFTNSAMWDIYGVRDPVWAYMYKHTVVSVASAADN